VLPACLVAIALAAGVIGLGPSIASASTTTSVTFLALNSPTYMGASNVGVQVTATSGGNPTSGTVTITDSLGNIDCTSTLAGSDVASCSGPYGIFEYAGQDTFTADYSGSGSYGSSSAQTTVTIAKAATTLSINATPATVGQTTTVTGVFSPSFNNESGTLTITDADGALDCSINTATTSIRCTSSALTAVSNDVISASWTGNSDVAGTTGSYTLDVGQASTVISSVTATPSQVGQTSTIRVQLSPTPDGGYVTLSDADNQIGSSCAYLAVSATTGAASCTTSVLTKADASDALSASYGGDANYSSSAGSGSLDVGKGTATIAITANPDPAVGSTATYIATISPPAAGATGGTVAFSDTSGAITDCSAQSVNTTSSTATCTSLDYSSTGTDHVTASYGGSANWASASSTQPFTISQGSPNVSISVSPTPVAGTSVTITAVVSPSDGGGTVSFSGNYISGCSAKVLSGDAATCTTSTLLSVGSWTVTASYSGDTSYDPTLTERTVTIAAAPTTVSLVSSSTSPQAFAPDTLTATVLASPGNTAPDGGTVTFSNANGAITGCSDVALSTTTGQATCAIGSLPGAGTDDLTATYSGDTNYGANTGSLDLGISKISTTVGVSESADPVTVGSVTTITITVAPAPDGGTVSVFDSYGDLTCSNQAVSTVTGQVACTTRALSPGGVDSLAVSYSGDTNYGSSSGNSSITVNRIATATTITSSPTYAQVNGSMTVTVTVSPATSGYVAFTDTLGQVGACSSEAVDPSTGEATCTTGALTSTGQDRVTATFLQTNTDESSAISTTIAIDSEPDLSQTSAVTIEVGQLASGVFVASGYPAPSIGIMSALPSGISISSSGVVSGVPASGEGGVYSITATATNQLGSTTGTLVLVIDQAPSMCSPTSLTAAYGTDTTFQVTSCAGTYPTASISLSGGLPAGMTLNDNRNGTATITGAPDDYVSGDQTFGLVVSNSVGSVNVGYTIDVTGTPAQPSTTDGGGSSSGGSSNGGGTSDGGSVSTVTVPSTHTPGTSTVSPLQAELSFERNSVAQSTGIQPRLSVARPLPSIYDPMSTSEHVVRRGKKVTITPVVQLGPDTRFPTLGNVGLFGDCTVVATSNIDIIDHLEGRLTTLPRVTTNLAVGEWSALNGDTGSGLSDSVLLKAWTAPSGLLGTRIAGWHSLTTTSERAMKEAILASGALYAAAVIPEGGVSSVYEIDPALNNSTQVGGHAFAIAGWDKSGWLIVSWGQVMLIPFSWWIRYGTEAYAVNLVNPVLHKVAKKTTTKTRAQRVAINSTNAKQR